ncbi:MAG: hypothetical protein R3Y35_03540 [Clostridia bacterium]
MAKFTLQEFYLGDEYNVMGEAVKDLLTNGSPDYEERTGIELLIAKHSIKAAIKMIEKGDFILDLESEMKSLSLYLGVIE